jgi:putative ABC transport system ATP-binding protein
VLVAIPVLLGASAPLLAPMERRTRLEQHARAGLASSTTDLVSGLRVLHGLGAVASARAAFDIRNQDARRRAVEAGRIQAGWEAVGVIVPGALLAVIVAVGHRLVVDGTLSIGELVGFLALGQFLLVPLATLLEVGDVWTRGLASARRAGQLLDTEPAVADGIDSSAALPCPAAAGPALEVSDVADAGVLDGCRLAVEWGEVVAVATADDRVAAIIAELAARDRDPDRGTILVRGVDARRWPLSALRRTVLVATGDGLLVDGTLAHNVAFGRSGPDGQPDAVVRQAMTVAALDDVVAALPDGAGSPVGERGRFLSGGQRQRIGLARALAAEPPVLVLVDPTSAVDAHTENAIAASMVGARRAAGMATVLITTSPTLLAAADRVVHLHGGRVAGAGTHLELVASCPTYRSMVIAEPTSEPRA